MVPIIQALVGMMLSLEQVIQICDNFASQNDIRTLYIAELEELTAQIDYAD